MNFVGKRRPLPDQMLTRVDQRGNVVVNLRLQSNRGKKTRRQILRNGMGIVPVGLPSNPTRDVKLAGVDHRNPAHQVTQTLAEPRRIVGRLNRNCIPNRNDLQKPAHALRSGHICEFQVFHPIPDGIPQSCHCEGPLR